MIPVGREIGLKRELGVSVQFIDIVELHSVETIGSFSMVGDVMCHHGNKYITEQVMLVEFFALWNSFFFFNF